MRWLIAIMLIVGIGAPSIGGAAEPTPPKSWTDHVTFTLSDRMRGEFVDWFDPPEGKADDGADELMIDVLFATITNANFDDDRFLSFIDAILAARRRLSASAKVDGPLPDEAVWSSSDPSEIADKARSVGFLAIEDEDVRSLTAASLYTGDAIWHGDHHLGTENAERSADLPENIVQDILGDLVISHYAIFSKAW